MRAAADVTAVQGSAMYAPEKEVLVWKIKNFPGGKEFMLRCKFGLPSVAAEEEPHGRMPPIRVTFEIPYFTVSGIQAIPLPSVSTTSGRWLHKGAMSYGGKRNGANSLQHFKI